MNSVFLFVAHLKWDRFPNSASGGAQLRRYLLYKVATAFNHLELFRENKLMFSGRRGLLKISASFRRRYLKPKRAKYYKNKMMALCMREILRLTTLLPRWRSHWYTRNSSLTWESALLVNLSLPEIRLCLGR